MSLFLLILKIQYIYIDISNSQHVDEGTIGIYIKKPKDILCILIARKLACDLHMIKWKLLPPMELLTFKK